VFWQRSLTVALATEALTRLMPEDETEDDDGAFATGLLHDIGRLVLDQFYPEAYDEATRVAATDDVPLVDAERRILEPGHAEIGAHLAARWQLPEPIVRGIRLHHSSDETAPSLGRLAALIHVAELVCNANGLGDPLERARPAVLDAAFAAIGVGGERSEDVLEATVAAARKSSALLVFSN
jgi:putative nucleotidyltransferase with HDIG domain